MNGGLKSPHLSNEGFVDNPPRGILDVQSVTAYASGLLDGGRLSANASMAGAGPKALAMFAQLLAARPELSVKTLAAGILAGDLTAIALIDDIDVPLTQELFKLKDSVERLTGGSFELQVKPAQGRPYDTLIPPNFYPAYRDGN